MKKAMAQKNADPAELDKFSRLADLWWDEQGAMGMLHRLNPLRIEFMMRHVNINGAKVLDVGCGGGILSESLAGAGAIVTGIDLSEPSLAVARQHSMLHRIPVNYRTSDVETLAFEQKETFDVVACMEMLEHVPDPARAVAACAALLKPGGTLFFSTINRTVKAFLFAIVGGEYLLRLLPRGTHEYRKLIKPVEMDKWSRQSGLSLIDTASFVYNPFTEQFSLKNDADVNYICCYRRRL